MRFGNGKIPQNTLQILRYGMGGTALIAGVELLAPCIEVTPRFFWRSRIIHNIIRMPAKRISRKNGLAFFARQKNKGEKKISLGTSHNFGNVSFEIHERKPRKKSVLNNRVGRSRFVTVGRRLKTSQSLSRIFFRICIPPKQVNRSSKRNRPLTISSKG